MFLLVVIVITYCSDSFARVQLPSIFSDHMVLQRNSQVEIWGWGSPWEDISVTTSWDNNVIQTKPDGYARWQVVLNTPDAGGPYDITIQGSNSIILSDVLIGEVWIASGQSNMQWSANSKIDSAAFEIQQANHPNIRFFEDHRQNP